MTTYQECWPKCQMHKNWCERTQLCKAQKQAEQHDHPTLHSSRVMIEFMYMPADKSTKIYKFARPFFEPCWVVETHNNGVEVCPVDKPQETIIQVSPSIMIVFVRWILATKLKTSLVESKKHASWCSTPEGASQLEPEFAVSGTLSCLCITSGQGTWPIMTMAEDICTSPVISSLNFGLWNHIYHISCVTLCSCSCKINFDFKGTFTYGLTVRSKSVAVHLLFLTSKSFNHNIVIQLHSRIRKGKKRTKKKQTVMYKKAIHSQLHLWNITYQL